MSWNTHIPKFRRFVLQNFPFIEEDFDALTDYALICKVVKYLNTVINSQNEVIGELSGFETSVNNEINQFETSITEDFQNLTNLFNQLQSFVENYFENLDVQEEINTKLDEMVEDGTFDEIINDRIFGEINKKLDLLTHRKYVLVGDSYLGGYDGSETVHSWGYYFKQYNGISDDDCYIWYESGAGFVREGSAHNYNFRKLIQAKVETISNADEITDVIIAGGVNDNSYDIPTITNAMAQCLETAKTSFPNARIYVGCIGNKCTSSTTGAREAIAVRVLPTYKNCNQYGAKYLTNIEMIAHDWSNYGSDDTHMSETGYQKIGAALMDAMDGSYNYINGNVYTVSLDAGGSITDSAKTINIVEYYMGHTKLFTIKEFNLNDFTAFAQSGTDIVFTDDGEIDNLHYLRRVFERVPAVECELELTFTDSQYNGYYAGTIMITSNGALQFHTNSTVNGKSISGIRLRYPVTFEIGALIS